MFGWTLLSRNRLEDLEKRLGDMEEAHQRVVDLEVDWQDYQHKFRNILARLNQREKAEERGEPVRTHRINPAAARLLGIPSNGDDS